MVEAQGIVIGSVGKEQCYGDSQKNDGYHYDFRMNSNDHDSG